MSRIAVVTTSYPDRTPGNEAAGSFVEDFALELSKTVDVTVCAASSENSIRTSGRLEVRRFVVPRLPLSLLRPHHPFDWPAVIETLRAGRRAVRDAVREQRPDHILALWALPSGWWAQSAGQGINFSTWALGSDIWSLGRVPLIRHMLKTVLRRAEHRFADGLGLCSDVEKLCGMPCSFLPSTRRLPAAGKSGCTDHPPYKLAFLGRWHPNKGTDLLMHALQALRDDDWNDIEEIRIFGGGPLGSAVNSAAEKLNAARRPITTGGYLDKTDATELIGWADYLLLPSRVESIPVIFSDAAQIGTPLVATPVGDLPQLHERFRFGVLADAVTPDAYARAIRAAVRTNPAQFQPGLERAATAFNLEATAQKLLLDIGLA